MLPEIEAFGRWLGRKFPGSSTRTHYTSDLGLFFDWLGKPPHEVTVRDVDRFIEHGQQDLGYQPATLNRKLACLKAFYDFLAFGLDSEAPPANPVLPRRHYLRRPERLPRDVEDETLAKLFAVVTNPRDRAMFLLMLRCGLRVSEVRALSLSDLYLKPAPGLLPRLWLRGKGNKERVVYLSDQALVALQAWLAVRPTVADEAVFLNRWDTRYSTTGIRRHLGRYCERAGVWVTCHQFRHTLGRHLAERRVPPTSIQRLFGHARLKTTEGYIHISDTVVMADYTAAMRDVAQRLPLPVLPAPASLGECPADVR
jgi:site-specific recombinase XerD